MQLTLKIVFLTLGCIIPFGYGLKCWMTPDADRDRFMNKYDRSQIIVEKTCDTEDKYCVSEMYGVNRFWYIRLGCDKTANATGCTNEERGKKGDRVKCFCDSDFCNSGFQVTPGLGILMSCLLLVKQNLRWD